MSADDQDRLTFGEGPLGGPLDTPDADASPRRNRAFVYIAVAMAGLILLGLLGLVFVWQIWLPGQQQQRVAAVTGTVQAITREAASWTATPAPTATPIPPTATPTSAPTLTPVPTATSTKVVSDDKQVTAPTSTPKATSGGGGGTSTPAAGLGAASLAAIGVGLAGLLFVARKMRG